MSRIAPKLLLLALLLAAAGMIFLNLDRRPPNPSLTASRPEPDERLLPDPAPLPTLPATPDYSLIEPGLYVGGFVAPPPPDVRAVLCLSEIKDPYTAPIHQWSPIPDAAPAPSLDWLRRQVAFIDAQRRAGNAVFVHCDAGISRSPMVAAAYLMWRHRWTRDQAMAFIRTNRSFVSPNPAFMDLLEAWEQFLVSHPPTTAASSPTTNPI